ncbi:putative bifunctional diguanylate cyclase/phosphodiesterase [Sphingomicrobium astaxanthinifaciens]|uniref:putative bifunctional diguanylate cyclase/phosphodiesterase n=1 Tax=Sphingomicrobium astaxanthinifaciens TaxID=1227949 RepID=UPI001FCAA313|nr:EAL domain-containing protein [Sphingomicrobium astaxanthinifaciens]
MSRRGSPSHAPHLPPSSFSFGDLLKVDSGRQALIRAVRWRQVNQFTRISPKVIMGNLFMAAVQATVMAPYVSALELSMWLGTCTILCGLFAMRHHRLNHDADYRARQPATFASATLGTVATTVLWWAVPLLWFGELPPSQQLVIAGMGVILMSTGAFMLVYVPPAAVAYTVLMSVGGFMIAAQHGSPALAALVLFYCMALVLASLVIGRELFVQTRSQMELSEMGELVELLRELDAPGSGGLWELDADLNFTKMSQALTAAIDLSAEKVRGRSVFKMIDPDGRYRNMSSGVRQLFSYFREELPFRDVVVPQVFTDRWWSLSGRPHYDDDGKLIGWKGVASDVTESRTANADALGAARSDPLTGIANRLLIRELLEQALLGQMNSHGGCALLLVDLDRFKLVNDTLGHAIGDKLLCAIAERLAHVVGDGGHVGRLGGDEFAIIWHGDIDRYSLSGLAERVVAEVSRGVTIGAANINVGATIGIAIGPDDGNREDRMMRSADLALYSAKRSGRGGYAFYDRAMLEAAEDHRLLENDVREALKNDDMRLAYQPIVDARTGKMVGREALLRWRHPTRGEIAPDRFIPIIEDSGLIHQIGDWVIREACNEAANWDDQVRVAVNVSAAQLSGAGLAKTVVNALALSGLHPHRLELEVTESIFLGDDPDTLASIERLRGLGVRMVLDDFGKGYSSFGYLSRAHFSKVKIDASFVRAAAAGDQQCVAIVNAILALATGLGIETTAEGVETTAQADVMRELGVGSLQGFLFGRPEILGVNVVDMAQHRRDIA